MEDGEPNVNKSDFLRDGGSPRLVKCHFFLFNSLILKTECESQNIYMLSVCSPLRLQRISLPWEGKDEAGQCFSHKGQKGPHLILAVKVRGGPYSMSIVVMATKAFQTRKLATRLCSSPWLLGCCLVLLITLDCAHSTSR